MTITNTKDHFIALYEQDGHKIKVQLRHSFVDEWAVANGFTHRSYAHIIGKMIEGGATECVRNKDIVEKLKAIKS